MKKTLSSKNLAKIILNLANVGKSDLVLQILENSNFSRFSDRVTKILLRHNKKIQDFTSTKIFAPQQLSSKVLLEIEETTKIDISDAQIIIDKSIVAGTIIKSGSRKIDASFTTMLRQALQN